MLAYHPALDAYHSAFRMLRVLAFAPTFSYEREKLRILDFYLAFPNLISDIRLPQALRGKKTRVSGQPNKYRFTGAPRLVFQQMNSLQDVSLNLLASSGIVDKAMLDNGSVKLSGREISKPLAEALSHRNSLDAELTAFIVSDLATIPLLGRDGLKHRTELMEYRYDAV